MAGYSDGKWGYSVQHIGTEAQICLAGKRGLLVI
jgi:hypothetical protein